jgi:NADPH:quinone reductase-like Zn-dependent oxidoreductase
MAATFARREAKMELESTGTMQAAVRRRYGLVEEVRVEPVGRPAIGDREVLVRVRAAGVDRGVWHLMAGKPYLMRIAGFGLRAPRNPVLGRELAGVVEAAGAGVSDFGPGDEVFGVGEGTFAELAPARAGKLAPKPQNITFEQAAAVGISGQTALQAVRDHGRVADGQKVLVIGASGGVGSFAVQIARAFGARVTGVCSTAKVDLVRSLGAERVIDYTREDFAVGETRYDLIIDTGGNTPLPRLRRALAPNGTLVIVGGEGGGAWFGGMGRQLQASMQSRKSGQRMVFFITRENAQDLMTLKELVEAGKVIPAVDTVYPLDQAAAAIRHMSEGRARGKVVLGVRN